MIDIAFVGHRGLGGVRMRGRAVAAALDVPFFDLSELRRAGRVRTLVLVKAPGRHAGRIRRACERLIYDPLDAWLIAGFTDEAPQEFWRWTHRTLAFDEVIATSPACAESMQTALPDLPVHIAPHHADPAIAPAYDPEGPVVYAGARRYVEAELGAIRGACRSVGRDLLVEAAKGTPRGLAGASLVLHPRLPPYDTPLNRYCKPQVKLENAAAAGCPAVASDDPCVLSLRSEVVVHRGDWRDSISAGLAAQRLAHPITIARHVETLRALIRSPG